MYIQLQAGEVSSKEGSSDESPNSDVRFYLILNLFSNLLDFFRNLVIIYIGCLSYSLFYFL